MLNLAIVGLQEGLSLLHAAHDAIDWRVHTLCDLNQELLQQRQQDYQLNNTLLSNSIAEVIANPAIDAVALFTPDHLHAEQAVACLDAGKHLLLTKPIATSSEEVSLIESAIQRNKSCIFFAGHTSRFIPSFMDQHRDYSAGKLGELLCVETEYNGDKRKRASYLSEHWGSFSPLHIWLIHSLDLALWYLDEISKTQITTATSQHFNNLNNGPDNIVTLLQDNQGALGLVKGFYGSPQRSIVRCTIRGTQGYSTATYPQMNYFCKCDGSERKKVDYQHLNDSFFPFQGFSHHVGEMRNILAEFTHCIEHGHQASVGIKGGCTLTVSA